MKALCYFFWMMLFWPGLSLMVTAQQKASAPVTNVVIDGCGVGAPTTTNGSRCGTGSVVLYASQPPTGFFLYWYNEAGTLLYASDGELYFNTPVIATTTTYYVAYYKDATGCVGTKSPAVATVNSPTVFANAGPDITGASTCGLTTTTLSAATPSTGSTAWTIVSGSGGSIANPSSPTSSFSGSAGVAYTLRWSVTANGCVTTDDMVVQFNVLPTTSNAGADQTGSATCGLIGVTLSGNTPSVGTGTWIFDPEIVQSGGSISNASSPNASLHGQAGNTYGLLWQITNGPCVSQDGVIVKFNKTPTTANAGADLTGASTCGQTQVTLAANTPADGTGSWSIVSGSGGSFNNTASPSSVFYGVAGNTYTLRWTISTTLCGASSDDVVVKFNQIPSASAGPDQTSAATCGLTQLTLAATPPSVGTGSWSVVSGSGASFSNAASPTSVFYGTAGVSYLLRWTVSNGVCSTATDDVSVLLNAQPNVQLSASALTLCAGGSATISISNPNNVSGTSIQWSANPVNADIPALSGTGNSITGTFKNADGVNNGSVTYTVTPYTSVCTGAPATATITINNVPNTPVVAAPLVYEGNLAQFAVVAPQGTAAQWYNNSSDISPIGTGNSFTTSSLNVYVSFKNSSNSCESPRAGVTAVAMGKIAPSRLITEAIRLPGQTTDGQLNTLNDTDQKAVSVTYTDGMSRVSQTIAVKGSASLKDAIQPAEYDSYGRSPKTYLPYTKALQYTTDNATGMSIPEFQAGYVQDQHTFYTATDDKVSNDESAFAQAVYEASPLGRILEQGSVGADWQPGTTHTTQLSYSFNTGATSGAVEEVRRFNSDGTSAGFYTANTLSRMQSTDPDGNQQVIFQDGRGNTIARKQQLDQVIDGVMVNWLETYYIYDDFGHIRYVISPKGVATLKSNGWALSAILDSYVHQFVYDEKGRLIEKKTPGQDWSYVVYDPLNRVVLAQDAQARASNSNQWTFLKYDQKGRTIMQGIYTNGQTTRSALQQQADHLYTSGNNDYSASTSAERRGNALHGYTNVSFPKTNEDGSPLEVWNVVYYDNYDFDNDGNADYNYTTQLLPGENTPTSVTRGLTTGSKRVVLGTSTWLYSYVFYDDHQRAIQVRSNNHLSAAIDNLATSVYDFEGKTTYTRIDHHAGSGNQTTVVQRAGYDPAGRIKNIYRPVAEAQTLAWTNLVGVTTNGNTVTKTINSNSWYDGAMFSTNGLAANQNGWITFRSAQPGIDMMLGLSDQDLGNSFETIDYAVYFAGNGNAYVFENGSNKFNGGPYSTYDVFSVERKGSAIYYKKNNAVFYTSLTPSSGALYADGSMYTANSSLVDVRLFPENEKNVVQYEYNELGQVVDKKLYNTTGNEFLQSVDYRYTLQGQLASINNAQLTTSEANDDTDSYQDDYFGMEYLYHTTESGLNNTARYNGNISAMKWKGAGSGSGAMDQSSYKFVYDKANQLLSATSQKYAGAWNKEANTLNENMSYDHNGNIQTLQRNQRQYASLEYTAAAMDNLAYSYNSTMGDRLEKVTDAATAAGFNNGGSGTGTDYTYDTNGNILTDNNKGINNIVYNLLGKPAQITFADGTTVSYLYDATGNKLAVMKNGDQRTDYVNGFQYENGALTTYAAPEGRIVMKGSNPEYQYAIADHQGNTRVVFSSAPITIDSNTADMESAENVSFQNYNNLISFDLMDHTDAGTTYTYAQKITGASTGVARSMKVYPGDKVKMEGYGKYYNAQSTSTNLTAFAGTLLNAFGLPTPAVGEVGTAASAVNGWGSIVAAGGGNGDDSYPKLFVNILVFDKNYNLLDMAYEQIDGGEQTGATKLPHDYMSSEYTAKEEGYVFMYFSNESPTQVEFYVDDVTMSYTPTNVVQYNEYYPFGLQTSNSWTRDNSGNNYLYNEGSELNATTGLYDLPFRNYDATLGRFFQVDPLAHTSSDMTSYHYAGNNPVVLNDPSGLMMKSPYTEEQEAESAQNVYKYMSWATDNKHIEAGGGGSSNYYGTSGGGTIELTIGNTTITIDFSEMKGDVYSLNWEDGEITDGYFLNADGAGTNVYIDAITDPEEMAQFEPSGDMQGPWFKDEEGKSIFNHWMGGSGTNLTFVNGTWGSYMRRNSAVMGQLGITVHEDLRKRTQSGYFSYTIDGDTGYNDYETGYGLLHATSNYNIQGWATNNGDGTFTYWTVATWSDRIDPNYEYWKDYVAKPLYLVGAKDYDISITWTGYYTLQK